MHWPRWALGALNILLFVFLLILIDAQGAALIAPGSWEYKDLIAVLLSTVSIIVTFIGIIIAVAAIWGFQAIKSLAEEKAVETSKLGSAAYLGSDAFKADLKLHIDEAMQIAAKEAIQDALTPMLVKAESSPEHQVRDEEWRD